MKTSFIPYLLALCLLVCSVSAVAAAPPEQLLMGEMASRLALTETQQAQIGPALERRNARLLALREDLGEGAPRRQRMKALREARSIQQEFVSEVSPLLTSEQKAQWEELREEMRDKARERRQRD